MLTENQLKELQMKYYFIAYNTHYYDCKMTVLKLTEQTFDQNMDCYWRWVNNITGDNLLNIRISYGRGSLHEIEESIEFDHQRKSFMENFNKKLQMMSSLTTRTQEGPEFELRYGLYYYTHAGFEN